MGLRPSVKSDDDSKISSNSTNYNETNTSNSESNISKTTSSPPQRQAWTVRGQLLLNFHDAISRAINTPEMIQKCNDIAKDMARNEENDINTKTNASIASQSYHHQQQHNTKSIAKEYEAEAALIVENKTQRDNIVRNKSLAVGLFAFITLRSGRGISSLVRKAIANRSSVYKFDNIPSTSSVSSSSMSHHAAQTTTTSAIKQPSTIRKFINLSIDISISTTLALLSGTYIFIPRPSSYIEDMSQLPLVQGKSVYAEMVCPPLIKEYRKVMEQFGGTWPVSMSSSSSTTSSNSDVKKNENDIELTQEDVSLNIIRKFVENCSKRSKYERALLEERNAFNNEEGSSAVSRMMRRITGRDNNTTAEVVKNVQLEKERVKDSQKKIQRRKTKLGTVSIPSPGVPEDVAVDVDLDVFDLTEDEEE